MKRVPKNQYEMYCRNNKVAPFKSPTWDDSYVKECLVDARMFLKKLRQKGLFKDLVFKKKKDYEGYVWLDAEDGQIKVRNNGYVDIQGKHHHYNELTGTRVAPYSTVQGELGRRCGFNTHEFSDRREPPCIEDLADPIGAQHWPDYVNYTDNKGVHHEGPGAATVANKEDMASYMRLTRQHVHDRSIQHQRHPVDLARERFTKKYGKEPEDKCQSTSRPA